VLPINNTETVSVIFGYYTGLTKSLAWCWQSTVSNDCGVGRSDLGWQTAIDIGDENITLHGV